MVRETFSVAGGRGPGASVCVSVRWWRGKGVGGEGRGGRDSVRDAGGDGRHLSLRLTMSSQRHSNITPSLPHPPAPPPPPPSPAPVLPRALRASSATYWQGQQKIVYCYLLARRAKDCVLLLTGKTSKRLCTATYWQGQQKIVC